MNGRTFVKSLPAGPCQEREDKILEAVLDGDLTPIEWHEIQVYAKGHKATIKVSSALQLGFEDPVRFNVTHPTAQKIADAIDLTEAPGAVLPTAKIVDDAWLGAAHRIKPCLQPSESAERAKRGYSPSMSDTLAMLRHHDDVQALTSAASGLCCPEGKHWVCTNRLVGHPELAANYGLEDATAPYRAVTPNGGNVWQPGPGIKHTVGHTDYSQIVALVRRIIIVDGAARDIEDVARDPELCWLVSSEGVMQSLRHPAVPRKSEANAPDSSPTPITARPSKPVFTRNLRRGCEPGMDVAAWQAIIGVKADGVFGPGTESATIAWQKAHGLTADGIVGPASRRVALEHLVPGTISAQPGTRIAEVQPSDRSIVLAKNYTPANRKEVHWIVIHVMEAPEKPSTAEAVANWIAGKSGEAPLVSFHWAIDCDSLVMCVPEQHVAWHAMKANRFGVGYEHAGYVSQTREEWLDDYSESMLWLSAKLAAQTTIPAWNLPADNFVNAAGLKKAYEYINSGKPVPNECRGLTTHMEVTKGLGGTHTDPGVNFPLDHYMSLVKQAG